MECGFDSRSGYQIFPNQGMFSMKKFDEEIVFDEMAGKVITKVIGKNGDNCLTFETNNGEVFKFFHEKDGNFAKIDNICGDLNNLVGKPLLSAKAVIFHNHSLINMQEKNNPNWIFYRFSNLETRVDIRWYDKTKYNYSEEVSFYYVDENGTETVYEV